MKFSSNNTYRNILQGTILLLAISAVVIVARPNTASATYEGGNLISDSVFLDSNSMGKQDIQNFLNSKGSGLANKSYELSCYSTGSQEYQWYTAAGASCNQSIPAAHIIYYAAQIYGINPQVILATIQKEQSLATSSNPTTWQLDHAMGYGCPTGGGCSASDFAYQIDSGAWVLRFHFERARGNNTWWNNNGYTCGNSTYLYNPGLIPGTDVTFIDQNGVSYRTHRIANAATASLYCFTPHAYNNPAGLYGHEAFGTTGLYYSGSYNFVYWFEIWFGTTVKENVIATVYDGNTDNTGETASIGFRLSSKPSSKVIVPIEIKTPENARIVSSLTEIIFTPENWNDPKKNRIFIAGKYNPNQTGTIHYKLDLRRPITNDSSYSNIPSSNHPDVFLTHQLSAEDNRTVWRVYNKGLGRSIFTASAEERTYYLSVPGWVDKGLAFSYCSAGDQTVIRLRKNNERKFVIQNSQEFIDSIDDGYQLERVDFATSQQGSEPIYWFHKQDTSDNFYTPDSRDMTGYQSMGIIFYACDPDVMPVYRLYNSSTKSYFYTTSARERKDWANQKGFSNYQGNGFYACENGIDLYRLFRPSTNGYIFALQTADVEFLETTSGFLNEGVTIKLCTDGNRDVYSIYRKNSNKTHLYTTYESEKNQNVSAGASNQGVLFKSR